MDVWRITVAAVRRWYVLLPLLALTVAASLAAGKGVHPEYDVTGTAMVVPGKTVSEVPNPYGNVDDANTAVGIVLNSPTVRSRIAAQGLDPAYEVVPQDRSTILNFSIRADDASVGTATGEAVIEAAEQELRNRQTKAGVPVNARYGIQILQAPALTAVVTNGKTRNMAIIGVLGAGMSLLVAVFFDDVVGLIRRRRRRKTRRNERMDSPSGVTGGAVQDEADPEETPDPDVPGTGRDGSPNTTAPRRHEADEAERRVRAGSDSR